MPSSEANIQEEKPEEENGFPNHVTRIDMPGNFKY